MPVVIGNFSIRRKKKNVILHRKLFSSDPCYAAKISAAIKPRKDAYHNGRPDIEHWAAGFPLTRWRAASSAREKDTKFFRKSQIL
jgi:hypothetical protein